MADLCAGLRVEVPPGVAVFVGCAQDAPESELNTVAAAVTSGSGGMLDPRGGEFSPATVPAASPSLRRWRRRCAGLTKGPVRSRSSLRPTPRCLPEAVHNMARERRLLSDRDDGTIPGEAAVAMLVATPESVLSPTPRSSWLPDRPLAPTISRSSVNRRRRRTDWGGRLARWPSVLCPGRFVRNVLLHSGPARFSSRGRFRLPIYATHRLMPEPLQHELIAANLGDTGAAAAGMASRACRLADAAGAR